ncbi:MAG TPA: hypothetical protein VFA18_21280 [Gemmataceae bacterium]|nr:hypothetical protein [Gemmataceae bacterium]
MGVCDSDFGKRLDFTHRRCRLVFEQSHPENGFRWETITLQLSPVCLGDNLKLYREEARRLANIHGRLP